MVTHEVEGREATYVVRGCTKFIKEHFGDRTDLVGVEVGVWRGENAEVMRDYLSPKLFILVDIWTTPYEEHKHLFANCLLETYYLHRDHPNVVIIRGDSAQVAEMLSGLRFDFVYLDGDHYYNGVLKDIESWYPLVKSGGVLGGHDYNMEGPRMAVDKLLPKVFHGDEVQGQDWWMVKP